MKALLGIALAVAAVAAVAGGQLIATAVDHAVDAPRARFDVAANARIEQLRRESAERLAAEQAADARCLAPIIRGLHSQLTMDDYNRLQIGMPAGFAHAALAPFQGQELAEVNGITSYLFSDGPRSIIV